MGALHVKLRNARRERLDDSVDLQVVSLRTNTMAGSKRALATHPYDIHQILTFRQEVAPLYDLA